ncbi:MAG: hypothetical protein GXX86_03635 [Propionibacterium sp.]|nr:hypothetical protein [Propionibacterium sp.]
MTTPASPQSPGSPQQLPGDEGYQPVRRDEGEPLVPRPVVAAPQPVGITMQPPRRGIPMQFDDGPGRTGDEPDAEDEDTRDEDARGEHAAEDAGRPAEPAAEHHARDTSDADDPDQPGPAASAPSPDDTGERPEQQPTTGEHDAPAPDQPAATTPPASPPPTAERAPAVSPYARPADGAEPAERPRRTDIDPGNRITAGELVDKLSEPPAPKASRGWRAMFNLGPSAKERAEMDDLTTLRRSFERPITIMVANPKGGVGKTPLSLLLAATFGTARGGGVVAWDNNELRGTMPDRSVSEHRLNVRDLLAGSQRLRASESGFTDVAKLLNHQTSGNFHTLGSTQASGQAISRGEFETVHEILGRFFELIVVDTGNNEAAPNWLAAADTADCLVVPTKWRKDSLIPAARMLESMQDINPELLDRTLVVATNAPAEAQKESRKAAAQWFGSRHQVLEIPTDPHIAEGDVLDYEKLQPETRRAVQVVAAAIIKLLG